MGKTKAALVKLDGWYRLTRWSKNIKRHLKAQGLLEFIESEVPKPVVEADIEEWQRNRDLAKHKLWNSLAPNMRSSLNSSGFNETTEDNPKAIFHMIVATLLKQIKSIVVAENLELVELQAPDSDEERYQYIADFLNLYDELTAMGSGLTDAVATSLFIHGHKAHWPKVYEDYVKSVDIAANAVGIAYGRIQSHAQRGRKAAITIGVDTICESSRSTHRDEFIAGGDSRSSQTVNARSRKNPSRAPTPEDYTTTCMIA
ncbi:Uu.00g120340.m01.CDS01 [Anthostomella pinea]|uniref:Uu.00g120340.m01.CDS01 n=1 Tax=Anthostomella pinea TaxID=933095 RepID=A0AAI8VGT3_9PEZI|nr:Uu.00g120340.m01.CDS01 [Anthostomella pinea]